MKFPVGVRYKDLQYHHDPRGWLTEVHRDEWHDLIKPLQWTALSSSPLTLRGVRVHLKRFDYLTVLKGEMFVGLKDLRSQSPTFGLESSLIMHGGDSGSLLIPPGVGHGFFFPVETLVVQAMSERYDENDEFGCIWNDPDLQIPWPVESPLLSDKDRLAPSLKSLLSHLEDKTFLL